VLSGDCLARGEQRDCFGAQDRAAALQQDVSEGGDILGGREKAGVPGDSAQHAGVLVLHLTLNNAMAKGLVVGGGWNGGAQFKRWIERRMGHAEWPEDFSLAETIEALVGQAFQGNSQHNESDVAVLGVRTGVLG